LALLCCIFSSHASRLSAQIIFDIHGATATYITGINSNTDICGYATFPDGQVKGFIYGMGDTIVTQYSNGTDTWFGGLNDQGQVVGRYNSLGGIAGYVPFIYDIEDDFYEVMTVFDGGGYESISPNDINNQGWVSGDLWIGPLRRIFTWHVDVGLATNFVFYQGAVRATYGGHFIDELGRSPAYYLLGTTQVPMLYSSLLSVFTSLPDLADPIFPSQNRTRVMAYDDQNRALIQFPTSRKTYIYHLAEEVMIQELYIPNANETYGMDMNGEGYIAGYFIGEDGITHGFFQAKRVSTFDILVDGFNFANTDESVWNEEDYADIDYSSDPFLLSLYGVVQPFPLKSPGIEYPSSSYSSWESWCGAFALHHLYQQDPNVVYYERNPNSFYVWDYYVTDEFSGACSGMCMLATIAKNNPNELADWFPGAYAILTSQSAHSLSAAQNDVMIDAVNVLQNTQLDSLQMAWGRSEYDDYVHEIAGELFSHISNPREYSPHFGIRLYGLNANDTIHGNHAIIPISMSKDPVDFNRYNIGIYDPNEPGSLDKRVQILMTDSTSWYRYNFGDNETNWTGLGIMLDTTWQSVFTGSFPPVVVTDATAGGFRIEDVILTFKHDPNIQITDGAGGVASIFEGGQFNTIPNLRIESRETGRYSKAYKYGVGMSDLNITSEVVNFNSFNVLAQVSGGAISYSRPDAQLGEQDGLVTSDGMVSYINVMNVPVNLQTTVLTAANGMTFHYACNDIIVQPGQNVGMEIIDATHINITSNGAATNYDVSIRIFDPFTGFWEAEVNDIPIGANVTQQIIPDLNEDTFDGVIILNDANGDGEFEGSESIDNAGIPLMLFSQYEISVAALSGGGAFYVSNVGSGNLNWNVTSSPQWVTINAGQSGVNHGPVQFTSEDNEGLTRIGYIVVEEGNGGVIDSVTVTQLGINHTDFIDPRYDLTVWPNPVVDFIRVERGSALIGDAISYEVIDIRGAMVGCSVPQSGSIVVDTRFWAAGTYTIRFKTKMGVMVKQVVKAG